MNKKLLFLIIFVLSLQIVCAYRLPTVDGDTNMWGTRLNNWLGEIHTENGTLKTGLNVSVDTFNITSLTNCDTIDTDANGVLSCGSDGGGGNCSVDLSCDDVTYDSEISSYDTSSSDDFNLGNYTTAYFGEGTRFLIGNFTSNYYGITDRFKLSNYSTEYSSTGFDIENLTAHPIFKVANFTSLFELRLPELFDGDNVTYDYNTTQEMQDAINTSGFYNIQVDCDNILFDNGYGSAGICDGLDAAGGGGGSGVLMISDTYITPNETATSSISIFNATGYYIDGTDINDIFSNYQTANFTSSYYGITDRFTLSNYSTEYSSTGFDIENLTAHPLFKVANFTELFELRLPELFDHSNETYSTQEDLQDEIFDDITGGLGIDATYLDGDNGFNIQIDFTVITNSNTTWVNQLIFNQPLFKNANFTALFENRLGELWNLDNLSTEYPNLDTDSTDDLDLTSLDNNTIIRASNITSWDINIADDFNIVNNASSWDRNVADEFNIGNYSTEYASTGFDIENMTAHPLFKNANFTSLFEIRLSELWDLDNFTSAYDGRSDRFGNANFTALATGYDTSSTDDFNLGNYSTEYTSTGWKLGNYTTAASDKLINGTDVNFNNVSITTTNTSIGNFFIFEYNSTCSCFRFGTSGGICDCD